jgi:hypothetical protein
LAPKPLLLQTRTFVRMVTTVKAIYQTREEKNKKIQKSKFQKLQIALCQSDTSNMTNHIMVPTHQDICKAVEGLEKEAVALLSDLVRFDSTLGNESKSNIQSFVADTFSKLGLHVDKFAISLEDIKNLQGFSPVDWSYAGKENVVGVHTPKVSKGKSLIINGHVDVVPTGMTISPS